MSANRSCLCAFTFADGRRCRSPRLNGHPHLCCFHAKREAQSLAAQQLGRDVSSFLSGSYLSACDLSSALGRHFSAVAQGQVKPKTASTLAYLGQILVQSIHLAQGRIHQRLRHRLLAPHHPLFLRSARRSAPTCSPAGTRQPALESTLAKV